MKFCVCCQQQHMFHMPTWYLQATGHILSPFSSKMKHYTSVLATPRRKCEVRYYRLLSSVTVWILVAFSWKQQLIFVQFSCQLRLILVTLLSLAARVIFCDFLMGMFWSSQSCSACRNSVSEDSSVYWPKPSFSKFWQWVCCSSCCLSIGCLQ